MNNKNANLKIDDFHDKYYGKLQKGDCLLDVRTAEEFSDSHIPGSVNISHELLAHRWNELTEFKRIFIYCRRGARAQTAMQTLLHTPVSAEMLCIFDAGMDYWNEQGYPKE